MQDPISDLCTQIRNAGKINKKTIEVISSRIKIAILGILFNEGYIENFKIIIKKYNKPTIYISLKYYKNKHVINTIKRISKPSLRIYKKINTLSKPLNGMGLFIISTPKGIVSDRTAKKINHGGEIICLIE